MYKYTFTDEQLFDLLKGIPELFREYVNAHGFEPECGLPGSFGKLGLHLVGVCFQPFCVLFYLKSPINELW